MLGRSPCSMSSSIGRIPSRRSMAIFPLVIDMAARYADGRELHEGLTWLLPS
jgi:hypothetical protein